MIPGHFHQNNTNYISEIKPMIKILQGNSERI